MNEGIPGNEEWQSLGNTVRNTKALNKNTSTAWERENLKHVGEGRTFSGQNNAIGETDKRALICSVMKKTGLNRTTAINRVNLYLRGDRSERWLFSKKIRQFECDGAKKLK